jgi:4-hydroxythreonine-4-phosphate dehydrogenase
LTFEHEPVRKRDSNVKFAPLAVTMGDPAGVGLELIARIAAEPERPPFFVIGDAEALARAAARIDLRLPPIATIARAADAHTGALCVLHEALAIPETPGRPDSANAGAIERAIRRGVSACIDGEASALVTLPIAKSVLYDAGFAFPGHTEFIGALTENIPWPRTRGPLMLIAHDKLKVAPATIHLPLRDVATALTRDTIIHAARVLAESLTRDFGIAAPRIALAALNPHAGESGSLGREEIEIINPAAAALRALGYDVRDAAPADTLFHAEARAHYDGVVAMYHDQGLIASKTIDFWGGVNATLGLPIVRTSPDHGAAFDIAGQGVARADSLRAALRMAHAIAQRRNS